MLKHGCHIYMSFCNWCLASLISNGKKKQMHHVFMSSFTANSLIETDSLFPTCLPVSPSFSYLHNFFLNPLTSLPTISPRLSSWLVSHRRRVCFDDFAFRQRDVTFSFPPRPSLPPPPPPQLCIKYQALWNEGKTCRMRSVGRSEGNLSPCDD